jgi:hypothetical protein
MGNTYSVVFKNNSTMTGDVCIYQTDPDITDPSVMSLAWFAKHATPTTEIDFDWQIDYSFVWGETGELIPGVRFKASQNWAADLSAQNKVTYTNNGGAYTFKDQVAGPSQGKLYIAEDGTIPSNMSSVGIGMSGAGTFVRQAQPNMNLIFTPHPVYWITFGNFVPGQVLDITEITNPGTLQFPVNVYSLTAILNPNNTWTIKSTAQVNAEYLAVKRLGSGAVWGVNS